jgi:hypothetical protein
VKLGEYEMANANTIVDALRTAGIAAEQAPVLTNPGGNNPWLFLWPAGFAANAGAPVALSVPVVQGEGPQSAERLSGGAQGTDQVWYADRAMFLVRAVGRVLPATFAKTLKIYLFVGNGVNPASAGGQQDYELGLLSATLPASSTKAADSNWFLEAKCLWDSSSLVLNGTLSGMIGGTAIAVTGFSVVNPTSWAAQQAPGSYNPLAFVVGANITSTAGIDDQVILDELTAEEL